MDTHRILDVQQVTVGFDGFIALDGLDFSMEAGEIRFLIGPNGAGKTTLLDVITGKTRPRSGRVLFDGRIETTHLAEHEIVRQGIGRKFQTPSVFASLSVRENLEVAVSFDSGLLGLARRLDPARTEAVAEMLDLTGLTGRAGARAGLLAHGEKQWLEIGMLLVQRPRLLLLDEPVAGMTRRERDRTGDLLRRISQRCSVLVVEHDMVFVRQFATTVTVMHTGRLLCEGPMEQVQADPRVIEVYLGPSRERVA